MLSLAESRNKRPERSVVIHIIILYIDDLKHYWSEQFTDNQITRGKDTKQQQTTRAERTWSRFASCIALLCLPVSVSHTLFFNHVF